MRTLYKFFLAGLFLFGCLWIIADPLTGLILCAIAFALFGSQARRERRQADNRRHQEMMNALHK